MPWMFPEACGSVLRPPGMAWPFPGSVQHSQSVLGMLIEPYRERRPKVQPQDRHVARSLTPASSQRTQPRLTRSGISTLSFHHDDVPEPGTHPGHGGSSPPSDTSQCALISAFVAGPYFRPRNSAGHGHGFISLSDSPFAPYMLDQQCGKHLGPRATRLVAKRARQVSRWLKIRALAYRARSTVIRRSPTARDLETEVLASRAAAR